jgi:N-terminal acetyltransferase B complex non-catalytic subunit
LFVSHFLWLKLALAEADKLLSTPAGQRLCATSLVIDEVRSQVTVKRNRWMAERERAQKRLEGIQQETPEEGEQEEIRR